MPLEPNLLPSRARVRVGLLLTALPVSFLAFDGVIKLANIQPVLESFKQLGYPTSLALAIGVLELACLTLYVMPRTSMLGALLLTGFLGGAISSNLRLGNPFLTHTLFPVYVAIPLWAGLFLRDSRVGALLPFRKEDR